MELILINQSKLKIMLTAPDMKHYELLPDKLGTTASTDRHTRAAFRHIFDDAEAQTGFHTTGERLLVQLFTSKCGGCEIFVTKLGAVSEQESSTAQEALSDTSLTPGEAALIRRALACVDDDDMESREEEEVMKEFGYRSSSVSGKAEESAPKEPPLRRVILSLKDIKPLLDVCRRLKSMGYTASSRVYIEESDESRTYHLCLAIPDGIFYLLPEAYAFLKEYGEVSRHRFTEMYLEEHGRLLCGERAVELLGAL